MNKDNYPENMPEQFKPIRPWGYVGYFWLFAIPIVGLIFMIVFACDDSKINRRNLARGYLWNMLIGLIIGVIFSAILVFAGVAIYSTVANNVNGSSSSIDDILKEIEKSQESLNSYNFDDYKSNFEYNI